MNLRRATTQEPHQYPLNAAGDGQLRLFSGQFPIDLRAQHCHQVRVISNERKIEVASTKHNGISCRCELNRATKVAFADLTMFSRLAQLDAQRPDSVHSGTKCHCVS